MANYLIDHDRGTLTITCPFSGKRRMKYMTADAITPFCSSNTSQYADSDISMTAPFGGYGSVTGYFDGAPDEEDDGEPVVGDGPFDVGLRLTAATGFGDTDTEDLYTTITPTPPGTPLGSHGTRVLITYSGTITFVFTLETFKTLTEGSFPTYGNAGAAPQVIDILQGDLSIFERFVPGEAVTVTVECEADVTVASSDQSIQPDFSTTLSGSAVATDTVNSGATLGSYGMTPSAFATASNDTCTASVSANDWLGASRPTSTMVVSDPNTSATVTCTISGVSASVAVSAGSPCQTGNGTATCTVSPDREYDLSGVVRRMEEGYPSAEVQIADNGVYHTETADSSGAFSFSNTQQRYSGSMIGGITEFDDDPENPDGVVASAEDSYSDSVDEWSWIGAELTPSWLTGQGLQSTLWPMVQRAFAPYDVFTLVQASERQVSSAYSGSGPSDISRTISLANGADDDLDGLDSLGAESYDGFSLHGYAYLVLRIKASAAAGFTVKIGSKEWEKDRDGNALTADTAYAELWIDLLNPTNAGIEESDKNSRWPFQSTNPVVVDDDDLWGVSHADTIILTDLDGEDYDVDWIKLKRDASGYSQVTVLPGFDHFTPAAVGDTEEYQVRLLRGDTDGVVSKEDIALTYNTVTETYTHRTLAQIAESINGGEDTPDDVLCSHPADGWTATKATFSSTGCSPVSPDLAPLNDCYLNLDRYAAWLEGGGAKYDAGSWAYAWRLDCTSARTMQAQMLYHRLLFWPPNIGDCLKLVDSTTSGPTQLRCASILKSRAFGVCGDENGVRASGIHVTVNGGTDGTGDTGADGTYRTGTPYPFGATTEAVEAESGDPFPSVDIAFKTRVEHRAAFRVLALANSTASFILEDWHGQLHLAVVSDGAVRYYRSNSSVPLPSWAVNGAQVTDGEDDKRPVMALDWRERLTLVFERDGDTYETVSDDDGATWSTPTVAITDGVMPFVVADRYGNLLEAAIVGDNIQGKFRAAGDTAWSSLFTLADDTATALVVDNTSCFSIAAAQDGPNRYVLSVLIDGEGSSSLWASYDEARTWERIA